MTSATLARVWIVLPTATTKASRCYFVHDIVLLFSMHCRVFCRCMCRMILSLCYVLLCGRAFLVDEPPLVDVLSHAMLNEGWVTSLILVFSKYWFVKTKNNLINESPGCDGIDNFWWFHCGKAPRYQEKMIGFFIL